jgi:hypothetical protein
MTETDRRKLDYRKGSEFGGVEGLIQPAPHDPADVPFEVRSMMVRTNPASGFPDGLNPETREEPPSTKRIQ